VPNSFLKRWPTVNVKNPNDAIAADIVRVRRVFRDLSPNINSATINPETKNLMPRSDEKALITPESVGIRQSQYALGGQIQGGAGMRSQPKRSARSTTAANIEQYTRNQAIKNASQHARTGLMY
jgi:hypothetical protein